MLALVLAVSMLLGPDDSGVEPVYPQPIPIVDTLVGTLSKDHRDEWRAGRNAALEQWGLPFTVVRAEALYPWTTENIDTGLAIQNVTPGTITIVRDVSGRFASEGGYDVVLQGGIVILSPWRPWWRPSGQDELAAVVAHEVGHALGFWHGGTGVMGGNTKVSDEERALAQAYYG